MNGPKIRKYVLEKSTFIQGYTRSDVRDACTQLILSVSYIKLISLKGVYG